jgi:spore maturation protein SpmA
MLNKIWFGLLCIGLLYGFAKAAYQSITAPPSPPASSQQTATSEKGSSDAAAKESQPVETGLTAMGQRLNVSLITGAQAAVALCLELIGIMALWLGMMNIAKDAGMIDAFARAARPLMRWLFPDIPDGHPAQGAILMNLSANMLGMDNAATPMGLKAMEELQTLNPRKDTATDSMVLFLAINNSSVTIIPFTLIGYRVASGSLNPAKPLAGILMVTTFSTVFAVFITKWLARRRGYQLSITEIQDNASSMPSDGDSRAD